MRILLLGGTWFLGRAVAADALRRGWEVTTFNRGRSGVDLPGVQAIHGDRTVVEDLARLATHRPWDAVIDTSSADHAPARVLAGARILEPVAQNYVYVSTVNAYRGWPNEPLTEASELLDAPADAGEEFGKGGTATSYYGLQKAGSERAVQLAFGPQRTTVLRPGVIIGPGEYVGRLPWWLRRAERGGPVLAPGSPDKTIQPVDVRDVAAFALDWAADGQGTAFNLSAPIGRDTMHDFLSACVDTTGGGAELRWAPDELLIEHGVRQWTELPLWRTHAGAWAVDSSKAHAAGFVSRPLVETVSDTWKWLRAGGTPVEHPRWAEHGISASREAAILNTLPAHGQTSSA
ncbi:NAD-dependent epimerase/dehydratase family protein [Streptomyces harbinensis]|uniref:NAD-dependent epimerase/dehydratase family protein n=1 Tax=Streptomyces harbinensis TaxID=1176198 RepID=UPI0015912B12|nr:NAD-dependent epimerase/dehydratase family protein [Streptomyces harbinensis]QKV67509.1 NAD-dependent epimerase/dehydratase family protein [Streptomyces harbinensis]